MFVVEEALHEADGSERAPHPGLHAKGVDTVIAAIRSALGDRGHWSHVRDQAWGRALVAHRVADIDAAEQLLDEYGNVLRGSLAPGQREQLASLRREYELQLAVRKSQIAAAHAGGPPASPQPRKYIDPVTGKCCCLAYPDGTSTCDS
ncbi:hypothetical protein tb265_50410 [Gemmatimonadetes bacterium T265]|nr:hypothetical protein tb265_50410 [Gemmatimonadetes bacterium T265]